MSTISQPPSTPPSIQQKTEQKQHEPEPQTEWTPSSWRSKPISQDVAYPSKPELEKVLKRVGTLPGLVSPGEIERLRVQLAAVQRNEAFILHAGDCAESFDACTQETISAKLGLILSFSLILIWGARLPVVRIGRIAGQYAKPRSSGVEIVDEGREVLSFRGDNVNGLDPDARTPDPERLLSAYFHSTATLNCIRSLLGSGFASLRHSHPRDWSLAHVRTPTLRAEFERITEGLADALDFTRTIGATPSDPPTTSSSSSTATSGGGLSFEQGGGRGVLGEVDFYTSHEGLLLGYEEALTRALPVPPPLREEVRKSQIPSIQPIHPTLISSKARRSPSQSFMSEGRGEEGEEEEVPYAYYNTSAHFVWIGDRTRQLDGAHVEYFRGIRNPIGIKVGPSMRGEELIRLLDIVNPNREPGRVTLITRYGASKIEAHLPSHITTVQSTTHPVSWICDPMHGNTHTSPSTHLKTRHFASIVSELTSCLRIHEEHNSKLGGVSLEFTGEFNEEGFSVTECLGGSMELGEEELGLRYQSFCDPRLNFEQSLDLAFLITDHFKRQRVARRTGKTPNSASLLSALGTN